MLEGHRIAREKVDIKFILGGKFAPATLEQTLLPKYAVDYRAWLPYSEMISTLYKGSIGIIVPHPIERYKTNYPVKLFEYMAAGMPVIASAEGESATFVREGDAGIVVDPLKPQEIAKAIVALVTNPEGAAVMGSRGRKLIFEKYNWEAESQRLIQLTSNCRMFSSSIGYCQVWASTRSSSAVASKAGRTSAVTCVLSESN